MAYDRDALLRHYRDMRADLLAAIAGIEDARLVEPPLDGWSVKDHLAHIALWDEVRAAEVLRISAGWASAWRMDEAQHDPLGQVTHALRRDLSLEQVRWELDQSHQGLLDAIAAASDVGLDGSRYGEAGLLSDHEAQHAGWIRRWRSEQGL
ncbi:MAG: DinB family protein [Dehalococcoidia bacterium]|nr:DinB family protein [Dehalococcoidia bacterium]